VPAGERLSAAGRLSTPEAGTTGRAGSTGPGSGGGATQGAEPRRGATGANGANGAGATAGSPASPGQAGEANGTAPGHPAGSAPPPPADPAPVAGLDVAHIREVLTVGRLEISGRLTNASNATLFGTVTLDGVELECVHKPVAGERPLWDFPTGTLANREVAAYELSAASGWRIVPPTVLREGQWGPGMCQLWIDTDETEVLGDDGLLTLLPPERADADGWRAVLSVELEDGRPALLAHRDDARLRRIAAFDVVINNADRKGGHLLVPTDEAGAEHVYGIDHGVTFAVEDKLRTLLWGFAGDGIDDEVRETLTKLDADLRSGTLARRLGALLDPEEVEATRERLGELLRAGVFPGPEGRRRPVPWPPF
jgi:uncharacterized repeat protein (TIGR03843 family)